ncbi:hypothetical protein FGM00_09720 [Aggregatimonas sangjinii]|uniref:Uncharacterized protein n=1 Tax=Aggregatimonas sangjinii TaxID=2583587 RepID=A0A5B7SPC4_9FLAO|nr:hypothetical protein [Aggregatimonas sangjinii]QCX00377.1 hypothetical protein FGM00_09720 [Aggregatimonas sangjinii]
MGTNSKRNIDELVAETLDAVSDIETVKAPPFFKDKVLNRIRDQNTKVEASKAPFFWFTPRYQLVALICFVVLNTVALLSYTSDSYTDNVENFAEMYGLSETSTDFYLYQN